MFESLAVITTLSLMAIFAALVRLEYRGRQEEEKGDSDRA